MEFSKCSVIWAPVNRMPYKLAFTVEVKSLHWKKNASTVHNSSLSWLQESDCVDWGREFICLSPRWFNSVFLVEFVFIVFYHVDEVGDGLFLVHRDCLEMPRESLKQKDYYGSDKNIK